MASEPAPLMSSNDIAQLHARLDAIRDGALSLVKQCSALMASLPVPEQAPPRRGRPVPDDLPADLNDV